MLRIIAARFVGLVGVLFALSILIYMISPLLPSDPVDLVIGEGATDEQYARVESELGLDKSLVEQYLTWIGNAVRGDLSTSYFSSEPVSSQLIDAASVSLVIVAAAVVISTVVGIGIGIIAALRPNGVLDRVVSMTASVGLATPNFWTAMLLVMLFALGLGWFPATGYQPFGDGVGDWARSLALPTAALSARPLALTARMTRASLLQVLNHDYIRTALGRGVPRRQIVFRHALRNAMVPVVTVVGVQASFLIASTVIVERVFALPGLGTLAINAIVRQDVPVVQGFVLFVAVITVLVGLGVDLATMWLNPRVRMS